MSYDEENRCSTCASHGVVSVTVCEYLTPDRDTYKHVQLEAPCPKCQSTKRAEWDRDRNAKNEESTDTMPNNQASQISPTVIYWDPTTGERIDYPKVNDQRFIEVEIPAWRDEHPATTRARALKLARRVLAEKFPTIDPANIMLGPARTTYARRKPALPQTGRAYNILNLENDWSDQK